MTCDGLPDSTIEAATPSLLKTRAHGALKFGREIRTPAMQASLRTPLIDGTYQQGIANMASSTPIALHYWVYADSCGLKTAFLGNGGRNAATIFSLRYSSSR